MKLNQIIITYQSLPNGQLKQEVFAIRRSSSLGFIAFNFTTRIIGAMMP